MESNHRPLSFQLSALPLSYFSKLYIIINKKYKKIKINQPKTRYFQLIWVNWSNLYLGKVPLVPIANKHNNKIFIIKTT